MHKRISIKLLLIICPLLLGAVILTITQRPKPLILAGENPQITKGWLGYNNSQFRFSFKYPEGLLSNFSESTIGKATSESLSQVSQKNISPNQNGYNVLFGADAWKTESTLEEFINSRLTETNGLKKQSIMLKNVKGIRITNINKKADAYFNYNLFKNGNHIYNFAIFSDDPILIPGNQQLLNDIISTVSFY